MVKLGKVLSSYRNCGIAMINIGELDKLGGNTIYRLSDYRLLMWQPTWLEIVKGKGRKKEE